MAFDPVNYSQQDPQWSREILGFGGAKDTVGYEGCALTSLAMLVSSFGYTETPRTLNDKLKAVNGFVGAAVKWASVGSIHPQIAYKNLILCANTDAPLSQIDASLAAGQPVLVQVDSSPAAGIQTHWVVLYARQGSDYFMLDPWPLPTETGKSILLMPRYSQGRPLQKAISAVVFYECNTSGSGTPSSGGAVPVPNGAGVLLQVAAWVTAGLRLRSAPNSLTDNTLLIEPANALLRALDAEADVNAKLGNGSQWIHVRDVQGREGYVSAAYVEKAAASNPPPEPAPAPSTPSQPAPTPAPPPAPAGDPNTRLKVVVASSVGSAGLKVYNRSNAKGKVVATLAAGAVIACLDTPGVVRTRIGVKGQWIHIRYATAKKGYVQAEFLQSLS